MWLLSPHSFYFIFFIINMNIEKILWLAENLYSDEPEKYEEVKIYLLEADEAELQQYARKLDMFSTPKRPIDFIDYEIIDIFYDWTIGEKIIRATKYIRYKDWGNNISEVTYTRNQWNNLYKKWYVDTYIPSDWKRRD